MKKSTQQGSSVHLTEAQWQIVMRSLLTVNAPMAETAPVYGELLRQLNPAPVASTPPHTQK